MRLWPLLIVFLFIGCDQLKGPKGDPGERGPVGVSTSLLTGYVPSDGVVLIGTPPLAPNTAIEVWLNADPISFPNTWLLLQGIPDNTDNSPWAAINYSTAKVGIFNASTSMTYKILIISPTSAPRKLDQLIYG
jgi:hypothetical protein